MNRKQKQARRVARRDKLKTEGRKQQRLAWLVELTLLGVTRERVAHVGNQPSFARAKHRYEETIAYLPQFTQNKPYP